MSFDLKHIEIGSYKNRQSLPKIIRSLSPIVSKLSPESIRAGVAVMTVLGCALLGTYVGNSTADSQKLVTQGTIVSAAQISQINALSLRVDNITKRIHDEISIRNTELDDLALLGGQKSMNKKIADMRHHETQAMISSSVESFNSLVKSGVPPEKLEKIEVKIAKWTEMGGFVVDAIESYPVVPTTPSM